MHRTWTLVGGHSKPHDISQGGRKVVLWAQIDILYWTEPDSLDSVDFFSYHQDPLVLPKYKFPLASPQGRRQQQRGGHSGECRHLPSIKR